MLGAAARGSITGGTGHHVCRQQTASDVTQAVGDVTGRAVDAGGGGGASLGGPTRVEGVQVQPGVRWNGVGFTRWNVSERAVPAGDVIADVSETSE